MTTKHARFQTALTQAIVDFFLSEDLYADELRIQGTVCVTADRSSIFVTQITETVTDSSHSTTRGTADSSSNSLMPRHSSQSSDSQLHREPFYHTPYSTANYDSYTPLNAPKRPYKQEPNQHFHHYDNHQNYGLNLVGSTNPKSDLTKVLRDSHHKHKQGMYCNVLSPSGGMRAAVSSASQSVPSWVGNDPDKPCDNRDEQQTYRASLTGQSSLSSIQPAILELPLSLQKTLKSLAEHRTPSCGSEESVEDCRSPPTGQDGDDGEEPQSKRKKDAAHKPCSNGKFPELDQPRSEGRVTEEKRETREKKALDTLEKIEDKEEGDVDDEHRKTLQETLASDLPWVMGKQVKTEPPSDFFSEWGSSSWVRRPKTKFSAEQLAALEVEYQADPFLSTSAGRRANLARRLNLTEKNIQIWFQNQRRRRRAAAYSKLHYVFSDSSSHPSLMTGTTSLSKLSPSLNVAKATSSTDTHVRNQSSPISTPASSTEGSSSSALPGIVDPGSNRRNKSQQVSPSATMATKTSSTILNQPSIGRYTSHENDDNEILISENRKKSSTTVAMVTEKEAANNTAVSSTAITSPSSGTMATSVTLSDSEADPQDSVSEESLSDSSIVRLNKSDDSESVSKLEGSNLALNLSIKAEFEKNEDN